MLNGSSEDTPQLKSFTSNYDVKSVILIQTHVRRFFSQAKFRYLYYYTVLIQRAFRDYLHKKNNVDQSIDKTQNNHSFIKSISNVETESNLNFFLEEEKALLQQNFKENNSFIYNSKNIIKDKNIFFTKILDLDLMINTSECYDKPWGELINKVYQNCESSLQEICLGGQHTLCLSNEGKVFSFGWNNYSQCGQSRQLTLNKILQEEETNHAKIINKIEHINQIGDKKTNYISIATGEDHSLMIDNKGNLYGFGSNLNGQLGKKNKKIVSKPIKINEFAEQKIISIACTNNLSFVINSKGEGYMFPWGDKNGVTNPNPIQIQLISEKEKLSSITCGNNFAIILTKNGLLYSMGTSNKFGQLGLGDKKPRLHPELIETFSQDKNKIQQVSCGYNHVIVRNMNNKVYTWGMGINGELGLGSNITEQLIPKEIKFPDRIKKAYQISAGFRSSYFLADNGKIYMFGFNGLIHNQFTPIECNINLKYPELSFDEEFRICRLNNCWNKSMSIFYATFLYGKCLNRNNYKNMTDLIALKWFDQSCTPNMIKYVSNNVEKYNSEM